MNELNILRTIGHKIPQWPHASGIANRILKPFFNRKKQDYIDVDVLGKIMKLDPSNCVDGNLLFSPQLYDFKEIELLDVLLTNNDTFVDVGAHIGFYSLMASKNITMGKIISIEASPITFERLKYNININNANITAVNYGISDCDESLFLSINKTNTGGQSFCVKSENCIKVECKPLLFVLKKCNVTNIKVMKLDIEGFEYKVLKHFFNNADLEMYPKYIITEFYEESNVVSTGNQINLLKDNGYVEILKTRDNRVLKLAKDI